MIGVDIFFHARDRFGAFAAIGEFTYFGNWRSTVRVLGLDVKVTLPGATAAHRWTAVSIGILLASRDSCFDWE